MLFILLLLPITWYIILQLFGKNNFELTLLSEIPKECKQFNELSIVRKEDSLSLLQKNYMNRIVFTTGEKKIKLISQKIKFFSCINQLDADILLINNQGLWGSYQLSREGVDRLFIEFDILNSY